METAMWTKFVAFLVEGFAAAATTATY